MIDLIEIQCESKEGVTYNIGEFGMNFTMTLR